MPDRAAIQSADPNERILAIRAAGKAKDKQAVPLLVDRLEDEDEAVRFFAILALDRITGRHERFGYDYAKPARERAKAVEQWRRYVRDGEDSMLHDGSSHAREGQAVEARASGTQESQP